MIMITTIAVIIPTALTVILEAQIPAAAAVINRKTSSGEDVFNLRFGRNHSYRLCTPYSSLF